MSFVLTLGLGLFAVDAAYAQQPNSGPRKQQEDACGRDVNRYCRNVIAQGDMVILSCLQQNRKRLTKACDKMLTDHGQ